MLVLKRLVGERVIIGTNPPIILQVVEIHGNGVRIGFDAPSHINIHREEVYKTITEGGTPAEHRKRMKGNQ